MFFLRNIFFIAFYISISTVGNVIYLLFVVGMAGGWWNLLGAVLLCSARFPC